MNKKSVIVEMPYERFDKYGAAALTNAELLAIILRTGTQGESATELARRVLSLRDNENQSLSVLYGLTQQELSSVKGIGAVKATKLLCITEIVKRMVKECRAKSPEFTSPGEIAGFFMEEMRHDGREKIILLSFDNRMRLTGQEVLSVGTANMALLSPREVFVSALRSGALRIVLIHNHPSGDPTPSREDIEITKQLEKLGELMGVQLTDHIIIGDNCFTSMRQEKILEQADGTV